MAWWMLIPAAISAASAVYDRNQLAAGNARQTELNQYNANQRYSTARYNLAVQAILYKFNAEAARRAGALQSRAISEGADYNAELVRITHNYNDQLLEQEEDLLWEKTGLDLEIIGRQRAHERGQMEVAQSVSGTVMGEGSNKDVIIGQMTQEAIDRFVVERGADIQAAKIANARAQGSWEADVQIQKILWEGEMGSYMTEANAALQASAIAFEGLASSTAGAMSAWSQYQSDWYGMQSANAAGNIRANNALVTGLFSAGSQAVQGYYMHQQSEAGSSLIA